MGSPCAIATDAAGFKHHATLREEIFGPATVVVDLIEGGFGHGESDILELLSAIPGSLTLTVFDEPHGWLAPELAKRFRAGRIIFNGPPTGVRVTTSMVHGGPFPATNRPDTTAVGPLAIERWCRPVSFQNCPDALLPPELRDANRLGILRTINGVSSRSPVHRG